MEATVTGIVSTITNAGASVGLVGAAVLGIYVAIKAFKWVKSAL